MNQDQERAERLHELMMEQAHCPYPWPPHCLSPMEVQMTLCKLDMAPWIPMRWQVNGHACDPRQGYSTSVIITVQCRETGQPLQVHMPHTIRPCRDTQQLRHLARLALIKVITHEMDEFLMFDGQRLNDPHKGEDC